MPGHLRNAASVILVRDSACTAPELFLVQRNSSSAFMGGQYVFPGGVCEDSDQHPDIIRRCRGLTSHEASRFLGLAGSKAIGHFVAAVRETFEEAGVLLAVSKTGAPLSAEEVEAGRRHLETVGFNRLLEQRDWYLDLARLRYLAHWVTPVVESRRFSARFFVAMAPSEQSAAHDSVETVDGRWMTAETALRQYADRCIGLPPPQLHTLTLLRSCGSPQAILDVAKNQPVQAYAPVFLPGPPPRLVLDGDPLHPASTGLTRRRFVLDSGRWQMQFDAPA